MPSLLTMMATIGANINPFQQGMQKAQQSATQAFSTIGDKLKTLVGAYFGFQALNKGVVKVLERAVELHKMADQFQITTDEIQQLEKAASKVGLSFDDFGAALGKMASSRKSAAEGNAELRKMFEKYGVTLDDLQDPTKRNIDLFKQMSEAMKGMRVNARDMADFRELFGRGGIKMIGAMQKTDFAKAGMIDQESIDRIYQAHLAIKGLKREYDSFMAGLVRKAVTGMQAPEKVEKNIRQLYGFFLGKSFKGNIEDTIFYRLAMSIAGANEDAKEQTKWEKELLSLETLRGEELEQAISDMEQLIWLEEQGTDGMEADLDLLDKYDEKLRKLISLRDENEGPLFEDKAQTALQDTRFAEARAAEIALEERAKQIMFGRANSEGKVALLRKDIAESKEAEARLAEQLANQIITQEEYEKLIAEHKLDQLNAEEQIYQLKKKGGMSFDEYRTTAQAAGLNPATYGASSQQLAELRAIRNSLSNRGALILTGR